MKDTSLVPRGRRGSLLAFLSSGCGVIIALDVVANEAAEAPHVNSIVVAINETCSEHRTILVGVTEISDLEGLDGDSSVF